MITTTNVAVTLFWFSLLRWLTLMSPALAAVLAEPGLLGEEMATVTEEGLHLLPGESMSSRVKREYTNNRAARRRVFKQTDLNGDGLVTRKEYVMKNGNMTTEELDMLFGAFDVDGDRSLSQDEFVRHGFLWVVVEECELEAIERCDEEFVRLIRGDQGGSTRVEGGQQGTLCTAFQTYFDCIEHEQMTCDITAYSQAVVDLVATYRTINFCPDLDFDGLFSLPDEGGPEDNGVDMDEDMASEMLSSDQEDVDMDIIDGGGDMVAGYRTKRMAHKATKHHPFKFPWSGLGFDISGWTTTTDSHNTATDGDVASSCTSIALSSCTGSFNDELQRNPYAGLCDSLSDYRHCVSRHARRCPEFELIEVEDRLRKLLQFHQKMRLC